MGVEMQILLNYLVLRFAGPYMLLILLGVILVFYVLPVVVAGCLVILLVCWLKEKIAKLRVWAAGHLRIRFMFYVLLLIAIPYVVIPVWAISAMRRRLARKRIQAMETEGQLAVQDQYPKAVPKLNPIIGSCEIDASSIDAERA
jgi:hypothetical protein